jgi:type I restriction enzyme S subunit
VSRQNGGIPSGWVHVRLEELGMTPTTTIDPSKEPNKEWELWSVPSFPTGRPEVLMGAEIGSTKQRVHEGDVLLCKINPRINRVWIVSKANGLEQIASGEWIVFRQTEVDPRFLMYRLREGKFREELCAEVSGVGGSLTRARPQTIKKLRISLPPLAEQRRIVAKIEALQERSLRAWEALSEVGPLLEQFRQSVLAAAFRGDLTADWRAAHPNVEPASELLRRIRAERRRSWEQAELAKYETKGQKPPKNW